MDKEELIATLRRDLDYVVGERSNVKQFPEKQAERLALRRFQVDRLAHTHADLLSNDATRPAAEFFLSDLYGLHDLSERDIDVERALPAIEHLLPLPGLVGVAEAIALDALSEKLDAGMAARLGEHFTQDEYIEAYRNVGSRSERETQLQHIERLGAALSNLVRIPVVGKALTMMKGPAQLVGLEHLQSFLERGYKAFATIKSPEDFVATVVARERLIMERLYSGASDLFAEI